MRSCHANAYGQWLQVNTTTVAGAPPGSCIAPSVSGRASVGARSPIAVISFPPAGRGLGAKRVADVEGVRCRGDSAVAATVHAARQPHRLLAGWLNVHAVDADRRRPDEALPRRLGLRLDLA